MMAMERRGHTVVWPPTADGEASYGRLAGCDVVHVYRRADPGTQQVVRQLVAADVPLVYDNDDNVAGIPKGATNFRAQGALRGQHSLLEAARVAKAARLVTTTCEPLAEVYRHLGAEEVRVIPNQLGWRVHRPTIEHEGIVIGWVAAGEHRADAERLGIAAALQEILDRHPEVRVEMIGIDLGLRSDRYQRTIKVPFLELPRELGRFDIGLAPLADLPFNRGRSDIKVKEYAASGVPWLASPVGPYVGLGENQGGVLVPDGEWLDALERLVTNARLRRKLSKRGRKWAKGQTIEATADAWEQAFHDAAAGRVAA
jgi:glycosyltransferase involved in cell wall biosynthesis